MAYRSIFRTPYRHFGGHFGGRVGGRFNRGSRGGPWFRRGRRWERLGGGPFGPNPDPQIQWAQSCLAQSVDPSVPQDGLMGPQTRQAIRTFQMQQQMPPTGILDGNTVAALQAACSGQQGAQPPVDQAPPPPTQQAPAPPTGHRSQQQQEAFLGDIFGLPFLDHHPPDGFPPDRDRWRRDHDRHERWGRERWGREMEGEFPFERPFFDFHHGERFPESRERWRWDRDRRWPLMPEAESGGDREAEFRPVRAFDFRPREGFSREGDRFPWDRDRRWFPGGERRNWIFGAPEGSGRISWAQSCLAQVLGPWVVQDGVMGPNTEGAIRRFQEQQQLPLTGALDEPTVNALHAACGR